MRLGFLILFSTLASNLFAQSFGFGMQPIIESEILVTQVNPGSIAEKYGLKVNDTIIRVDNKYVGDFQIIKDSDEKDIYGNTKQVLVKTNAAGLVDYLKQTVGVVKFAVLRGNSFNCEEQRRRKSYVYQPTHLYLDKGNYYVNRETAIILDLLNSSGQGIGSFEDMVGAKIGNGNSQFLKNYDVGVVKEAYLTGESRGDIHRLILTYEKNKVASIAAELEKEVTTYYKHIVKRYTHNNEKIVEFRTPNDRLYLNYYPAKNQFELWGFSDFNSLVRTEPMTAETNMATKIKNAAINIEKPAVVKTEKKAEQKINVNNDFKNIVEILEKHAYNSFKDITGESILEGFNNYELKNLNLKNYTAEVFLNNKPAGPHHTYVQIGLDNDKEKVKDLFNDLVVHSIDNYGWDFFYSKNVIADKSNKTRFELIEGDKYTYIKIFNVDASAKKISSKK